MRGRGIPPLLDFLMLLTSFYDEDVRTDVVIVGKATKANLGFNLGMVG